MGSLATHVMPSAETHAWLPIRMNWPCVSPIQIDFSGLLMTVPEIW